jgi:ubiquinone/menaquinone biosynthesis C-methylase UbiE
VIRNRDDGVIEGFGDEWSAFDQSPAWLESDLDKQFAQYFSLFPWSSLPQNAVGFDAGCGSGRWAKFVAPRVGTLHCCDPSPKALEVAKATLNENTNCRFHLAAVDEMPFPPASMDFGYSLGVLHHVPDTQAGLDACVRALKPGAPFLLYLYYAFDNRPFWFKALHRITEILRVPLSRLPFAARYWVSQIVAGGVYFPMARIALRFEKAGIDVERFPLSAYRDRSFYTMRTDALDRFGTRLEQRFTRSEIESMMRNAGLSAITFREAVPYWCALGRKRG